MVYVFCAAHDVQVKIPTKVFRTRNVCDLLSTGRAKKHASKQPLKCIAYELLAMTMAACGKKFRARARATEE